MNWHLLEMQLAYRREELANPTKEEFYRRAWAEREGARRTSVWRLSAVWLGDRLVSAGERLRGRASAAAESRIAAA